MRKLKMQIAVLAVAFAGAVAAKMYVDKYIKSNSTRQNVISETDDPGTVRLR